MALPGALAAPTVPTAAVGWALAQAGGNLSLAALAAAVADLVPVAHQARTCAGLAIAQAIGVVAGLGLATATADWPIGGPVVVAVTAAALVGPFLVTAPDRPHAAPHVASGATPDVGAGAGAVAGRLRGARLFAGYRDFTWALTARGAVSLANALSTVFLLYYLTDVIRLADPQRGLVVVSGVATLALISAAGVVGWLSDRSGRRKAWVIAATVTMAVADLLLAGGRSWPLVVAAAVVLGLGYGAYLGVDQALVVQVLPTARNAGRDLGVVNIANAAPQLLAPLIAAPTVTGVLGYPGLYLLALVFAVGGAVAILPIATVR